MEIKAYSPREYCKEFKRSGKEISAKTIIRKCEKKQLPSNVSAQRIGRTWVLFVGFY